MFRARNGFSIIEMTIVIIIISILSSYSISSWKVYSEKSKYSKTLKRMELIEDTIVAYANFYSKIPCPRVIEDRSFTKFVSKRCSGGKGDLQNYSYGDVPVTELNLPNDFMYDGWGKKFIYAIDERMTEIDFFKKKKVGSIVVLSDTGNTKTLEAVYALLSSKQDYEYEDYSISTRRNGLFSRNDVSYGKIDHSLPKDGIFVQGSYSYLIKSKKDEDILTYKVRWQID